MGVLEDRAAAFSNDSHTKLSLFRLFLPWGEAGSCWHKKTVFIDSRSTYLSKSSRASAGPWAKYSYRNAQRSWLALLLHPWLVSRELGMHSIPLYKMSFFILEKGRASLSRGFSASSDGSEH